MVGGSVSGDPAVPAVFVVSLLLFGVALLFFAYFESALFTAVGVELEVVLEVVLKVCLLMDVGGV